MYDAIIIGSGFGGALTAHALVNAGKKVLMLERGDWVPRGPQNWAADASVDLTPVYSMESPYRILAGGNKDTMGAYSCVGGPSVFYGGVSLRFREADFQFTAEIAGGSNACWPYQYADLEPYYTRAEKILNVAGEMNADPCEPFRSASYPQQLNALSQTSQMIGNAARTLNLQPFRLPLAINYSAHHERTPCVACMTCDTFACAIQAKNDLATCVIPQLLAQGLELKTNLIATRLLVESGRVVAVECFDKTVNQKTLFNAQTVILAAGALGSPHLLLASDLPKLNPGGHTVGRFLMRHCNAIVFGFFPWQPNPAKQFHKQLGIHDFYFGHPSIKNPSGKLGSMQQLQTPPVGLVQAHLPKPLGQWLSPAIEHLTGLLVMAEDQPQYDNRVALNHAQTDRYGLPQLTVTHHYTKRDVAACNALVKKARQILRRAGALFFYTHQIKTFSHAVGTVRMGKDPNTSALDEFCQFRGVKNLYVVDGSFMPTSAGLNPSLTISANALRVGEHMATHLN